MRRAQRNNTYQDPAFDVYRRQAPAYGSPEEQQEQPYQEEPEEEYGTEPPYEEEQPYDGQPLYEGEQSYWDAQEADQPPLEPEVISTSQAVNLTCTLAAFSGIFAFFLYIADRRSEAVRRTAVQSVALTGIFLCASVVLLIVGSLFRLIPFLGVVIAVIFWLLFAVLLLIAIFLKVQMMLYAYRGLAWQLPAIGAYVRRFE